MRASPSLAEPDAPSTAAAPTRAASAPASTAAAPAASRHDLHFARAVLTGLAQPRKSIVAAWRDDIWSTAWPDAEVGFGEGASSTIETLILERSAVAIAAAAGPGATLVEIGDGAPGAGSLLIRALTRPAAYVPVGPTAAARAEALRALLPRGMSLTIEPIGADRVGRALALRLPGPSNSRRLVYLPGPVIGSLAPLEAVEWLQQLAVDTGENALLMIGVETAAQPVDADTDLRTTAQHRRLLARLHRELGADLDSVAFADEIRFDAASGRLDSHLVSRRAQQLRLLGRSVALAAGEPIHTGSVWRYSLPRFEELARRAGWRHRQFWSDGRARHAIHVLERDR